MTDASWDPGRDAGTETTLRRLARRLAGRGLAGAGLALLLLRADALLPVLWMSLKSAKFHAIALVCCAEVSWLFGGIVGILLILQWLVHETAHLHLLHRLGHAPGWRGLLPVAGPYLGLSPAGFGSREAEALVALTGPLAGLCLAVALLIAGQALESTAVVAAAKGGFVFNLVQMLPFRPFDGGRIFPGVLCRYGSDTPAGADGADPASERFIAACRAILSRLRPEPADKPLDVPALLAEALIVVLVSLVALLALARILLPPFVFSMLLLVAFVLFGLMIAAITSLDPRSVPASRKARFAPRNGSLPSQADPGRPLPWSGRRTAAAALACYALLVGTLAFGIWIA